jgi:hypothetical protein
LRSCVAELGECGVEKTILLAEWLGIRIGMCFFSLESHIRIGDFWDWGTESSLDILY